MFSYKTLGLFSTLLLSIALASIMMLESASLRADVAPCANGDVRNFLKNTVGEWIGTSDQSEGGKLTDRQYFHSSTKQLDANSFETIFQFYRYNSSTGSFVPVGKATTIMRFGSDGVARNVTSGDGSVMVSGKPKNEHHDLTEVLKCMGNGMIQGTGSGKISVKGLPLGGGENGRITESTSSWSLNNGVFTVQENIKAKFKVFLFSKGVNIGILYRSRRGSDVRELLAKPVVALPGEL